MPKAKLRERLAQLEGRAIAATFPPMMVLTQVGADLWETLRGDRLTGAEVRAKFPPIKPRKGDKTIITQIRIIPPAFQDGMPHDLDEIVYQ